ncbi:MAG: hypothetical protein KDA80_19160, partial [Planctomycetaceae bacterium]|nr:hypothetical protein [Planctomycetaceae bacterium]
MVFLPGEVVVDYAIRLRQEFDPDRLWITAYANDCPCYIPSERVLQEGGYEGANAMTYYNKPNKFAPGLEDAIIESVAKLLPQEYHAKADSKPHAGLPPRSPVQSLARLNLPEKWTAQVVAAEPLTTDPVAFDFGPDRSLWVCEMHDYPSGLSGNFEPGGRVRLLRDVDGDGLYDRSTIFLDGLPFPTGVTVWRKGVLICAAPDILYAEDTDGDDRTDVTRVLFTGFGTENYQARVNSLTYGLDGWVYGACGLFGGNIECRQTGEVVPLGNRDFRIDPDRGILEPLTGRSQQGRVRNDDGDWFGCSNGSVGWNYPILTDEIRPGLSLPPTVISVPIENARQLYPAIEDYQRFKLSGPAGQVTAACGIGIYRDRLLGEDLAGNTVTCEPVNLLLHRLQLKADGLTMRGERSPSEQSSELVTSTDNWFRPVQVRTGPDGGLWVADMTRAVVEHPRWIPEEMLQNLDVRAGEKQGRILRLIPRDGTIREVPDLTKMSASELVGVLKSPNGTIRDLAQQVLLWNSAPDSVPLLKQLATSEAPAASRSAALWVLARYDAIDEATLKTALSREDASVRRQAWRVIAASTSKTSRTPIVLPTFVSFAEDETDPFVLREFFEALRAHPDRQPVAELSQHYSRHFGDRYLQFLVLRAVSNDNWAKFVENVVEQPEPSPAKLRPLLSISLTENSEAAMKSLLASLLQNEITPGLMATLQPVAEEAFQNADKPPIWLTDSDTDRLKQIIKHAKTVFADPTKPEMERNASAGLLGLIPADREQDVSLLVDNLGP